MKSETRFKIRVMNRLKEVPGLWFTKIQNVSVRGVPDLLMCYQGRMIAWELKTDIGTPDPLQEYTLANIRRAGGTARIVSPSNIHVVFKEDFYEDF